MQIISLMNISDAGVNVGDLIARADAYFSEKRLSEAIHTYSQVLDLQPQNVHALHCAGLASFLDNQIERARQFLSRATLAAPDRADILEQSGLLAALANDGAEAEAYYRRALNVAGSTTSLYRNLADCLRQLGRLAEAKEHYEQAISMQSDLHHAIRAIARISTELRETEDAADYWLRAWALDPSALQDGLDLIVALSNANRSRQLAQTIEQLRTRFAGDAEALRVISGVLNENHHYADGFRLATQGLATNPENHFLYYNAARALWMCGHTRECLPYALQAARLWPEDASTSVQYFVSCVQLALGNFDEGWKQHKIFYTYPSISNQLIHLHFPEWNGEPLSGCRFLYVLHQGFGDQIQFLRFVEWLHRQGATVDVLVDLPLAGITASMTGVRAVYTHPTVPKGPYEYWSYMMRIPEYMNLKLSMLPLAMPYIATTQDRREHWRTYVGSTCQHLDDAKGRRVGFVWKGSPNTANDRFRSIRLEALRPLFGLPSITWFSVQKGDAEEKSKSLADEFDVHTLGPMIEDFSDTLAILETFDLLITVDSSVAHLAGAAGLPVWVLLPAYSEWRWLADRTDSPWYPSMRLFRQRELGQWGPVIEEVHGALRDWCVDS
jgi:tetratricopeptide (TPR) repeat protein